MRTETGLLFLLVGVAAAARLAAAESLPRDGANWYTESFLLLHEDHHTQGTREVGRDAVEDATQAAIAQVAPDGFWFDGSVFTVRSCYCDACVQRFKREYKSEAPRQPGEPKWPEYQEMQRQIYREFVEKVCRFVHRLDPHCLVGGSMWPYDTACGGGNDE